MARSFPADTKLQSFIAEQYEKEAAARLAWFLDGKGAKQNEPPAGRKPVRGGMVPDGLPKIIPMDFARRQKQEEDRETRRIIEQARKEQKSETMFQPPKRVKDKLYDGFTKEEKGRYQYLKMRKQVIPEKKFSFPMSSSMVYGWKLDDQFQLKRPRYARSSLVHDTFYTRNQIPGLEDPTSGTKLERAKTIFC